MGPPMADYYELIGVPRTATADEIKKAYRQRAREFHPDANPDDAAAADQFKKIAQAYQVLSDDQQRARYDRYGEAGVGGARGGGQSAEDLFGGGLGDIFETFFGGAGGGSPFGGGRSRGPAGPPVEGRRNAFLDDQWCRRWHRAGRCCRVGRRYRHPAPRPRRRGWNQAGSRWRNQRRRD